MDALPPAPRVALRPSEPVLGEPEAVSQGITELRSVGEALTRAPAVYEDAGRPRRSPPVPPPPAVRPGPTHSRTVVREAVSVDEATLPVERARLEQARQLLVALAQRVTDRLSVLDDFVVRLDRVQAELRELNDASHRVRGENDALLAEIRKALAGLPGTDGPSPASATPPPPVSPVP